MLILEIAAAVIVAVIALLVLTQVWFWKFIGWLILLAVTVVLLFAWGQVKAMKELPDTIPDGNVIWEPPPGPIDMHGVFPKPRDWGGNWPARPDLFGVPICNHPIRECEPEVLERMKQRRLEMQKQKEPPP